jgi:hypothetical protein
MRRPRTRQGGDKLTTSETSEADTGPQADTDPEADASPPTVGGLGRDRGRLPAVPRWLIVVAGVAVLLGVSAYVIGSQFGGSTTKRKAATTPTAATPHGYTQFTDPGGLFAGSYPSSWKRLQSATSSTVLLVEGPDGDSYLVGKTPLKVAVGQSNLGVAKVLTDHTVKSASGVKYLHPPEVVALGGLPGYLYLYTFNAGHGQQGAHAFYFLFDGKTMITLVFQSLPSTSFLASAPLFDTIAKTFHVLHG